MIYYSIFVTLFVAAFIFDFCKFGQNKIQQTIFWIFAFIIFLLAAFRYETGYDYVSYKNMFAFINNSSENMVNLSNEINIEIGFIFLMRLFKYHSFNLFIIFISFLAIIPKIYFIYKIDKNKFLMLFCYFSSIFLTYDMGIIRQGISLSIILFSIKYLLNKNIFKFLLIVIIASLFHSTSLIFIFIYILKDKKFSTKFYLLILVISLFIPFFLNTSSLITSLSFFKGIIQTKTTYYTNYYEQTSIILSLFKRVIIMVVFIYYSKYKKNNYDRIFWLSINAYILSIVFMSIFNNVAIIATRGTVSLYMFQIICFGYIGKRGFFIDRGIIFGLCLILFFSSFRGPLIDKYNFYIPYETWIGIEN